MDNPLRFVFWLNCSGPAFGAAPPRDLLSETARLLRAAADQVERGEFYIPKAVACHTRQLHDAMGGCVGAAGFTTDT